MIITTTPNPLNVNNPTKEVLVGSSNQYLGADRPNQTGANVPAELTSTTTSSTTTINPASHSILPASGFYSSFQIAMDSGAIPEMLSSAKWSNSDKGYPQQTFLGASIRSFNMGGGFGDSSSSLTVDLVVDEYNLSDQTPAGYGDDVYHSGKWVGNNIIGDNFIPPIPGSPVYFKFGPNYATIEEAYRKTFDDLYLYNTISEIDPNTAGSASLSGIIYGEVNIPPNSYVDLYIPDFIDGDRVLESDDPRPIINYSNIRYNKLAKGREHIVFGGILQTYTQNRSSNGNPLYTVNVVDPREILSNVTVILNNYAGPTYEQANILNIYGFLEYNPTENTKNIIKGAMPYENKLKKTIATTGDDIGSITLTGDDKYYKIQPPNIDFLRQQIKDITEDIAEEKRKIAEFRSSNNTVGADASFQRIITLSQTLVTLKQNLQTQKNTAYPTFPMTGTGFSRRSSQGIPYYRVQDGINALMGLYGPLPQEYANQGFGGRINFRGFNYVVDFGGLPPLPEFYFLDFDQINLLELALEICDITNRDLFISLLPVIDHPGCSVIYNYNKTATIKDMVAGIIRIDTIDRSEQPFYGAVKTYIDSLAANKIYVENQDLGYELSNVTTDKFIVGAQEIDMYYFSANADRDTLAFRKTGVNGVFPNKPEGYQWTLEASLEQQILPYYGKLGNNAVTIPKGFGAYQQILLDSSSLNAAGVGAYYVATEMELRCAMISFDRWKEFLRLYNDVYMDSLESDDVADMAAAGLTPTPKFGIPAAPVNVSTNYAVSVPRSVFDTYQLPVRGSVYGDDGLPLSACNPPYGYPLYYKRMTRIGIPEGGLTDLYSRWVSLTTNLAELQCANASTISTLLNSQFKNLDMVQQRQPLTALEKQYYDTIKSLIDQKASPQKIQDTVGALENIVKGNGRSTFAILPSIAKKNNENAMKVYNFVKGVAEECLGKKFLVKIPTEVNLFFSSGISMPDAITQEYTTGPFGFKPRSTRNIAGYEFTPEFQVEVEMAKNKRPPTQINMMQSFLSPAVEPNPTTFTGALRVNYNPMSEKYESNYTPMNIGGYFHFDLYQNTLGVAATKDIANANFNMLPLGVRQGIIPQDLTNFINEDGRIMPYARFDNSEDISLEGLNDGDFTQQFIVGNSMVPDLIGALENTGPDEFHSFPNRDPNQTAPNPNKPKQVSFVKCSVDEQLYLPPRFVVRDIAVHAQQVKDIGTISLPQKIFVPCSGVEGTELVAGTGVYLDSFTFYKANYVPLPSPGSVVKVLDFERHNPYINLPGGELVNNSEYVNTDADKLNTEHVYALITLPNRLLPTKDSRFRDGPLQTMNTERFKHLMTMDVVRGLNGFNLPTNPMGSPPRGSLQSKDIPGLTLDNRIHAWFAMKKSLQGLSFGMPQQVNFTMPSPVYPDLVALPLMSNDRCYGPWVSSQLDGQAYLIKNIGGRVEFIKDENLSPWNYGGYHLLNEAGRLQAEFSNSLLLFSERGSFTVPDIPRGNSLCKALINGGPLVTSISLDISTGGARTTYQMDLYTASFGKLQKQKQEEFSKMSRERKKLISERNALIRKGMGKNQSGRNFNRELDMLKAGVMPGLDQLGLGMANALTRISMSSDRQSRDTHSSLAAGGNNFGSTNGGGKLNITEYNTVGSLQSEKMMGTTAQIFKDQFQLANNLYRSASAELTDIFSPYSNGSNPFMPAREISQIDIDAGNSLLYTDDETPVLNNDTTKYGDMV